MQKKNWFNVKFKRASARIKCSHSHKQSASIKHPRTMYEDEVEELPKKAKIWLAQIRGAPKFAPHKMNNFKYFKCKHSSTTSSSSSHITTTTGQLIGCWFTLIIGFFSLTKFTHWFADAKSKNANSNDFSTRKHFHAFFYKFNFYRLLMINFNYKFIEAVNQLNVVCFSRYSFLNEIQIKTS